ncbi:hypothetical protein INT45_012352 [Circinella minor]|uniref:Uncharacterized protein n=1 Tax=Circinella minor TaxID=1195481 RepID=A0A8H7VE22_9FUNG|nr:hypothetical protein INT45_012352 [Circinella minor]
MDGERPPADLDNYLEPALNDLKRMENNGIEVELEDGTMISSKIHLMVHNEKGHGIYFIDHSEVSDH